MLILGLDTATLTLSAALVDRTAGGEQLLARETVPPPTAHSSVLPGLLQSMLERAGKRPADLAGLVVGLGPGSFTGLRISLATAKALCYASSIPLVGASSLAAMALAGAAHAPEGSLLVPCLDARKGEVYCGFFRARGQVVQAEGPEVAVGPEALVARLEKEPGAKVFGIGREAYPALAALPDPGIPVRTPEAQALIRLVGELPAFDKQAVFGLEPHYVRPSDAEWPVRAKKK